MARLLGKTTDRCKWVGLLLLSIISLLPLRSQTTADAALQSTTEERVQSESWWPTKSTVPLSAFAGSAACAKCHADEARTTSSMQRASALAADAKFLAGKPSTSYTAGSLTYSVVATGDGLEYSVTEGDHKQSRRLEWVMGAGDMGHTFLYQADGHWYQSLATYYTDHGKMDITTGLSRDPHADLSSALGIKLSPEETRKCFGCHTVHATTAQGFNPLHAEAGLGCEACHGPAAAHAANGKAAVFNPATLSPADSIDFCGSCHRSYGDVASFSDQVVAASTALVRFQPYRLEESKCWRSTQDARLTCVACHDPHQPLKRDVAAYDRNCLQCHAAASHAAPIAAAKICPKASSNCVSCHMPKVNVPSMHGDFTDHYIRIAKAGEGFPR